MTDLNYFYRIGLNDESVDEDSEIELHEPPDIIKGKFEEIIISLFEEIEINYTVNIRTRDNVRDIENNITHFIFSHTNYLELLGILKRGLTKLDIEKDYFPESYYVIRLQYNYSWEKSVRSRSIMLPLFDLDL